jgi:hypothetical protein
MRLPSRELGSRKGVCVVDLVPGLRVFLRIASQRSLACEASHQVSDP